MIYDRTLGNGKQRETFVRFIGDDSLQCFRCLSSACTSCGMLTITASWGIMKQECPFWSTSPNYFVVLRGPLNSSLFKQERVTERDRGPAKAFSLYCWIIYFIFFANCKTSQQKTDDSRHTADLPLRDSVIKACSSSQCSDPMPHYKLGKWYTSSHRVGGMRAHLTSAHVRPEQLMMCRCRYWGETTRALWAIRWMTRILQADYWCRCVINTQDNSHEGQMSD